MLTAFDNFKKQNSLLVKQATRGLDKIQPTRSVTSRSGMSSFTEHSCEAGYHSHGDRKCHPVTDKHNGEAIQSMGGEYMYRLLHPSLEFEQSSDYMFKDFRYEDFHDHDLLLKQGQYDPCPGNNLHGHQGYKGCHSATQKHRKNTVMALGGWEAYVAWHPFMAGQPNPYEDEANAQAQQKPKRKTTKPKGKGEGAKQTPTRTRTTRQSAAGSGTPEIPTESTEGLDGTAPDDGLRPADKKIPQPTAASQIRRDTDKATGTSQLIFDRHDPRLKFSTIKEKKAYISGQLKKNAVNVEFNEELMKDRNPYMLSSDQWLAKYDLDVSYTKADGTQVNKTNSETMYAGKFRVKKEISKWNSVLNYANSFGETKKDGLRKVTSSEIGTSDWKLGMMMLFFQQSGLRIGQEKNVEEFGTYGVSTLRPQHVNVNGNKVNLNFSGKKGTENVTSFTLPKAVAEELGQYLSGGKFDNNSSIWGNTDVQNNRGNDYSWSDYYSNYVRDTYGYTSHRVRAYALSTEILDKYMSDKVNLIPDREDREQKVMGIVRRIAKEHGSESAQSVVKNYLPFEVLDKLVDGSSINNAKGFIEAHLAAMKKESKEMDKRRKSVRAKRGKR